MDLEDCRRQGFIKRAAPSRAKAASLLDVADIKEKTVRAATLTSESVNAFLPLAYDALRETLDALCLLHGYQVTNHVCLGEFLRTLIADFDFAAFDRFRYARNSINYYGRKVDLAQGRDLIKKIFAMRASAKADASALLRSST